VHLQSAFVNYKRFKFAALKFYRWCYWKYHCHLWWDKVWGCCWSFEQGCAIQHCS